MFENTVGTGLKNLQERLGCKGCFFADEKLRLKGYPCCTKIIEKGIGLGTGLTGECLEKKPVGVY